ncbi:uncharacterized protein LOC142333454 [Lycorma delicatula]|uniref:uncharacterized protein LOC142333454 n=1 Tax=Lycorma delicatula TaxID=130591 RepID=UPI003F5157C7
MRIIIYVMSFFMISAEKVYDEKELFTPETYVQHEKFPGLQGRCDRVSWKNGFIGYIKDTYYNFNASCLSQLFGETDLDKIKRHKYYEDKVIQLKVYEKYLGDNENKLLPTILDLLDAIPDKIIIKRGIINTEAESIVSGIDITKTIAAARNHLITYGDTVLSKIPCHPRNPNTKYGDLEYVIMDNTYIYGYYNCGNTQKELQFPLRDEETEKKIIKKIDIPE